MFKIGDRVKCVKKDSRVCGKAGTVVYINPNYKLLEVDWDNFDEGHAGRFGDGRKSVLPVDEDGLVFVSESKGQTKPVSNATKFMVTWEGGYLITDKDGIYETVLEATSAGAELGELFVHEIAKSHEVTLGGWDD